MKAKNVVGPSKTSSTKKDEERKLRQATALRTNLLRRKQQIRKREASDEAND